MVVELKLREMLDRRTMVTTRHWEKYPEAIAALLLVVSAICAVLTAVVLEMFALRLEGGGSITTMFPGFVYTDVLILKVSLVEVVVLLVAMTATRFVNNQDSGDRSSVPVAGIVSVLLPAVAPLVGAFVIVVVQAMSELPVGSPGLYFSQLSRVGVLVVVGIISLAALSSFYSLLKRERPVAISVIGLLASFGYLATIRYWEFYRLGFDQDRWNAI